MTQDSPIFQALLFYGVHIPNHPRKWWVHAKLRELLKPGIDAELDVVRQGLKWRLNPSDFEHETLFWTGMKDTWEIAELKRRLSPGAVFLDIGANFGYYSVRLADACARQIEVHAFEPHPGTFERLRKHIEWNGLTDAVHLHEIALSDTSGVAHMSVRADNSGASRITQGETGIEIRVSTLDKFAEEAGLQRVDCIKVDVEGLEPRMLLGGRRTIERFRPAMLIEFWTTGLAKAGTTPTELAQVLNDLGYQMYQPRSNPPVPLTVVPDTKIPENVLCLPK